MKKLLLFSLLALFTCFAGAQPISIQLNPSQYSGGYNLSCNGASDGSINLTITGGAAPFTILWDDTITSEDRVNLIAGTYSVIVVDSLSDSATASITLTEPQAISVSLYSPSYNGFNIHCNGGSEGEIVANVSGGVTPYSFLWSNDSITNSINGLAAGVYSVVVSGANGCIDSASKTITEPPLLNTSIASTVNASGYNINCGGKTTGNINLTVNGGASPYTYTWSSGHISEDLSNIGVGNFSVRVDDNNGCSKYDSLVITAPIELSLNITPILYPNGQSFSCVTCNDGKLAVNISGGVSPYTFLWSDTQANDTAVGLSSSAIPYTVTVTDALGCDSTISYLLNLPPPPPSPLFLSGYVSTHAGTGNVSCGICSDGSITLTVSGGIQPYSYNWNTGATTQNITNIDTGYYSVIVIDNAGDTVTQSFNVIYNSPPPPPTANIYLSFMNLDTMAKTVDVWVNNMGGPIGDFGFNLMSGILQQAYGGLAASNGYTVNAGGATAAESIAVLGSRNGGTIPSGNNHLTTLKFTGTMPSSICFMGAGGFKDTLNMPLSVSTGMCINTGVTPPPPPPPTTNVYLSFMNVDTALKTVEVWVNNMGTPIGDFGFNLMSGMLQEATGGLSATNGYTLSASGMTVLGARNGGTIPSGNYHLTTLKFSGSLPYNSICFMGAGGFKDTLNMPLSVSTGMCINTGVTPPPPPPPTTNVYLSFMNVDTALKTVEVWVNNMGTPIGDFGFNLMSGTLQEAFGGIAGTNGYSVSVNNMPAMPPSVNGIRNGSSIPSGNHHLVTLRFTGTMPGSICFMGAGGFKDTLNMSLSVSTGMCIGTGVTPPPPPPPPANNVFLSFMNADTAAKTVQVWVNNMGGPIGDFGFNLMSGTLQEAFGGIATANGYAVSVSNMPAMPPAVNGARNGSTIPSGSNHLVTLRFTGTMPGSICFMGAGGFKDTLNMSLSVSTGMCIGTGVMPPPPPPPPANNVFLSFMNADTAAKTVQVWVNNMGAPIGDFGFNLVSGTLQEAFGGIAAANGYAVSVSNMPAMPPAVNGTRNGLTIPSGSNHLVTLRFTGTMPGSICFMGAGGFKDTLNMPLSVNTSMCISTGVTPPPPPPTNVFLNFMNVDTAAKTVQVWINNMGGPIGDFGFNISSGVLQEAYGGIASANGYLINMGGMAPAIMISGGRNGNNIPSGNYHLITLKFSGVLPSSLCFMGAGGFKDTLNMPLSVNTGMCINTGVTPPPPPPPSTNVFLNFMNVDTAAKTVQVWINNMGGPIGDFGFNLMSGTLQEAFGGIAATNGYTVTAGGPAAAMSTIVMGVRNGSYIPTGNHHLTTLRFNGALPAYNICFMGAGGFKDTLNISLAVSTGMCVGTGVVQPPPPPMPLTLTGYAYTYALTGNVSCATCSDGSINLTVSGGSTPYTYNWSNGATTQNLTGIDTGYYSVTVTDMLGATQTQGFNIAYTGASVVVETPLLLSVSKSEYPGGYNVSCTGCSDGWASVTVTGGMPPYTFYLNNNPMMAWINGQTFNNLNEGSAHIKIMDMAGDSITTDIVMLAPMNQVSVSLQPYFGGCGTMMSGQINAQVNGGTPPYYYQWSGPNGPLPDNFSSAYITQPGTYYITVTDANNSTAQDSVNVVAPPSLNVRLNAPQQHGTAHTGCSVHDGKIYIHLSGGQPPYNVNVNGNLSGQNNNNNSGNNGPMPENGFSRYFYTSDTLLVIDSLAAGSYWVDVNDMSNCQSGSNVEIRQAESPRISVAGTEYENGYYFSCDTCHDAMMTAVVTGGNGSPEYYWFEVPAENANMTIQGASFFMNGNKDFNPGGGLPPAISINDTVNIQNPETLHGLVVTDELGCYSFTNFTLEKPKPITNVWKLSGNEVDSTSFIGTLNNDDFRIKTNDSLRMVITNTGEVAIGTDDVPEGYKLAVNGKVITEEVEVRLKSDWPDYVFSKDYNLLTAEELKKYIDEHGHLPNIPSAENVKEKGISLGEMDAMLLRKIEELTLYMLEMQKQNEELKRKVDELRK